MNTWHARLPLLRQAIARTQQEIVEPTIFLPTVKPHQNARSTQLYRRSAGLRLQVLTGLREGDDVGTEISQLLR